MKYHYVTNEKSGKEHRIERKTRDEEPSDLGKCLQDVDANSLDKLLLAILILLYEPHAYQFVKVMISNAGAGKSQSSLSLPYTYGLGALQDEQVCLESHGL